MWRTRWDAVDALGKRADPRGAPALVKRALRDDNPHPRWRSLWALTAVDPTGTQVVPLLQQGLKDPAPVVVRNAAIALGMFSHADGRPELIRGLRDPDDFRRWEAVFVLHRVADVDTPKILAPLLDEKIERSRRVRGEAALALGRMGGAQATLLRVLTHDSSREVRWRAAMALGNAPDRGVVDGLRTALAAEKDQQVRQQIEKAVARIEQRKR